MTRRALRWAALGVLLFVVTMAVAAETPVAAQERTLIVAVGHVADERETEVMGQSRLVQQLELVVRSGERSGEVLLVEHHIETHAGQRPYRVGDILYVSEVTLEDAPPAHFIVGYVRWPRLAFLALLLVALVVWVGRQRGALSLVGMAFSFAVIFALVLPRLAAGREPVSSALMGAALTVPVTYYMAHGLNLKTTVALVGSLVGLALTGLLAMMSVEVAQLTGYASEEAFLLRAMQPDVADLRGLLLAGMIVSVLGVLDDITVAQAAVVEQLREANRDLGWRQLYRRAMQVGQDHIASMVNTLVLVYAGAALPLLLLLADQQMSPLYALSLEPVAEEIVRMLVTSSGLVATVPITTLLAAVAMDRQRGRPERPVDATAEDA